MIAYRMGGSGLISGRVGSKARFSSDNPNVLIFADYVQKPVFLSREADKNTDA